MAKRYGCLPSHVFANADTMDYYVFDVALSWNNYQAKKHKEKATGKKEVPKLDTVSLQDMLNRVKERNI